MKTYRCVYASGYELSIVALGKAKAILSARELHIDSPLVNVFVEGEW
jgi:hypothetical protein